MTMGLTGPGCEHCDHTGRVGGDKFGFGQLPCDHCGGLSQFAAPNSDTTAHRMAARVAQLETDLARVTGERDALQRHYDAAGPEHNLLALLDLYFDQRREAEAERDEAQMSRERLKESLNRAELRELAALADVDEANAKATHAEQRLAEAHRQAASFMGAAVNDGTHEDEMRTVTDAANALHAMEQVLATFDAASGGGK